MLSRSHHSWHSHQFSISRAYSVIIINLSWKELKPLLGSFPLQLFLFILCWSNSNCVSSWDWLDVFMPRHAKYKYEEKGKEEIWKCGRLMDSRSFYFSLFPSSPGRALASYLLWDMKNQWMEDWEKRKCCCYFFKKWRKQRSGKEEVKRALLLFNRDGKGRGR